MDKVEWVDSFLSSKTSLSISESSSSVLSGCKTLDSPSYEGTFVEARYHLQQSAES